MKLPISMATKELLHPPNDWDPSIGRRETWAEAIVFPRPVSQSQSQFSSESKIFKVVPFSSEWPLSWGGHPEGHLLQSAPKTGYRSEEKGTALKMFHSELN